MLPILDKHLASVISASLQHAFGYSTTLLLFKIFVSQLKPIVENIKETVLTKNHLT